MYHVNTKLLEEKKLINACRSCGNTDLTPIIDLGDQYLSDFRLDDSKPGLFPLRLLLCGLCNLAQLDTTVSRELMYHDGYGYRSRINELIVKNLSMLVEYCLNLNPDPENWLDIACNDGTLLSLLPKKVYRVGVDPVKKFKKDSSIHANIIVDDFFPSAQTQALPNFDVITSISMFYDLDDPNSFVKEIANKLNAKGVWLVQQNYLLDMLAKNSFDNICHEHIEYYSLKAMKFLVERNGLEIFDVFLDDINGGSLVTAVGHKGAFQVKKSVNQQLEKEKYYGLESIDVYQLLTRKIDEIKYHLLETLEKAKFEGKRVQIYGASTRGSTIWQYFGIDQSLIESAVERQPEKIGKYFSAIGVPIISEEDMRKNPPDYLLIGPWFLRESFLLREKDYLLNGGCFIIPLPEVEIISKNYFKL
jgi:NDP-4-keto-2,6-dideoxyhexose 3-C-methyltransferase